ncbi:MAG: prenyltransferase/squalene oxidase repeat-containing protein [Pirellulales bacterium]
MVDSSRLIAAYESARRDLLAARSPEGVWVGRLSSSPLSTATAISALVLAEQSGRRSEEELAVEQVYLGDLSELIVGGLHWLANQQNDDGGWGDTDRSQSNVATTLLVMAAFHLTGVPVKYSGLLERASAYVDRQGGTAALRRRYGRDRTFAAPILTNMALAGLVGWNEVPALPFELACVPQSFFRLLRFPVVSYAIPALVAIGMARYHHARPVNPLKRLIRRSSLHRALQVIERMQPESGGYLEAVPLTSFVVMSLASVGQAEHRVARRGVEFLLATVRADGSWPIDTNLSLWNTTLAMQALAADSDRSAGGQDQVELLPSLDWVVASQQSGVHPMTGAAGGGWAWTDLAGGVPDTDDTSSALRMLASYVDITTGSRRASLTLAAEAGVRWLLDLQNSDGGWPTFCRGWGTLPFDRSAPDLTAHAIRALAAWRDRWYGAQTGRRAARGPVGLLSRIDRACARGWGYLESQQSPDGSWVPLWFGNQFHPQEQNPVYGTARVLMAYGASNRSTTPQARRGIEWLCRVQHASGAWSGGSMTATDAGMEELPSVEETALAVTALLENSSRDPTQQEAVQQGLDWLVEAVETSRYRESAPIGLYFAKLWYYEELYPRVFTVAALGRALAPLAARSGVASSPAKTPA